VANSLEERVVKVLVFDEDGQASGLELAYSPRATAGTLVRRFITRAERAGDETTHVLVDPRSKAIFPSDARLADCQLLHGQVLQILPRDITTSRERPILSKDDLVRLVVEVGPQIGMAWPLSLSSTRLSLRVEPDTGVLLTYVGADATFAVTLGEGGDSILVGGEESRLRIDGVPLTELLGTAAGYPTRMATEEREPAAALSIEAEEGETYVSSQREHEVLAGSAIEVMDPEGKYALVLLRVMAASDHARSRPVEPVVAYRVVPAEYRAASPESRMIDLRPMPELQLEKFSFMEFFLQQGPMLLMPLVFLGAVGPSIWLLAFAFYPVFILGYQLFRRARERDKHDRAIDLWRQSTERELDELRALAVGESDSLKRLHPPTLDLASLAVHGREGLWTADSDKATSMKLALGQGEYVTRCDARMPGDQTDTNLRDWRAYIDSLRLVANTPYTIDIGSQNVAIIGSGPRASEALAEVLLRLALTHSTNAIAFAALLPARGDDLQRLGWAKWLPHFSNPNDAFTRDRFFHGSEEGNEALREAIASISDRGSRLVLIVHEAADVEIHLIEALIEAGHGSVTVLWYGVSGARVPDLISRIVWVQAEVAEPRQPGLGPKLRDHGCDLAR